MILDTLSHAPTYFSLGARFQTAFDYLTNFDQATPDGRHDLEGDALFALVQSYTTDPPEDRIFESHLVYADIQYLLSGQEIIYYREPSSLSPKTEYDAKKDAIYYHPKDDRPLYLEAGTFVILLPQDAHKPGCIWDKPTPVRKIVMKLRLS